MPPESTGGLLRGARVYLSGPMDFVASREAEKSGGWRNRVGEFLRRFGVTVFDPWNKPEIKGVHEYGREDQTTTDLRKLWTFEAGPGGADRRSRCAEGFWPAMHVDLRMVDTSDFLVAYCPTNVYSVGTPHEIILARQQRKPVLLVSPRVEFSALAELRNHLLTSGDASGSALLERLAEQVPIKENPAGAPSLWYMPLIGADHFFDGFGFDGYREQFGWPEAELDRRERTSPLQKPLLSFLENLDRNLPLRWNRHRQAFAPNDDWLLWDLDTNTHDPGATITRARTDPGKPL